MLNLERCERAHSLCMYKIIAKQLFAWKNRLWYSRERKLQSYSYFFTFPQISTKIWCIQVLIEGPDQGRRGRRRRGAPFPAPPWSPPAWGASSSAEAAATARGRCSAAAPAGPACLGRFKIWGRYLKDPPKEVLSFFRGSKFQEICRNSANRNGCFVLYEISTNFVEFRWIFINIGATNNEFDRGVLNIIFMKMFDNVSITR